MPRNLVDLITEQRERIAARLSERNARADELAAVRDRTIDITDTAALEAQRADAARLRAEIAGMDAELDQMQAAYRDLEEEQRRDDAADRLAREFTPAAPRPAYDQAARTGREARTYRADTDPVGKNFLRDLALDFLYRDRGAGERLARHMDEERVERAEYMERATGTGAFAGLTVPQYLTDLYAPAVANLSPFADEGCNVHQLPAEGMTVNISRITTASGAALQASENAAVQETDMDDTLLTINVQTAAGQQTVSRQAIDRGTGIDDVTLQDLFKRVRTAKDATLLNQAVTGLSAVAQAVAYTDGTPTVPEMYPKILNAAANVEAALLGQAMPTHVTMHSRRWNWLQSQMSSTWPTIAQPSIPVQAAGVNTGAGYGKGVRGILPNGMLVIVDNNILTNYGAGTNEDEVYVTPQDECHLWQDANAPLFIRAEQTKAASLGVLFVAYEYFAYTFGRYTNGMGKIGGTGLVTPTF